MSKKPRKDGKPSALSEDEPPTFAQEPTLTEFIRDMHGEADKPQDGLPTLQYLKETFESTSARIRYLTNLGHEPKTIAKHLGIRYQHARNVANSVLKRGPNEDWRKPYLTPDGVPDPRHFKPKPKE